MQILEEKSENNLKRLKNKNLLKKQAFDFILSGIGCNCLVMLHKTGVLKQLIEKKDINQKFIESFESPVLLNSALITLEKCKALFKNSGTYYLTDFGLELAENIGLNNMLFDGYSDLISSQVGIAKNEVMNPGELIRGEAIANASILFGKKTVDPIIEKKFRNLKFTGTICDLGCGVGTRLSTLCEMTGNPGLGFEYDLPTVELASKAFKNDSNVSVVKGDVTKLEGVWEDVVILMQYFVLHGFVPTKVCSRIINEFLKNFPNLKYFFYVDIVSPSDAQDDIMPGFDYVHGLQNIKTRTYEETMEMFKESDYKIVNEERIPGLPNTFLWILSPSK